MGRPFTFFLGGWGTVPQPVKADVLPVAACPVGVAHGVVARCLWKSSRSQPHSPVEAG